MNDKRLDQLQKLAKSGTCYHVNAIKISDALKECIFEINVLRASCPRDNDKLELIAEKSKWQTKYQVLREQICKLHEKIALLDKIDLLDID